jgi:hypothetical protein
MFGHPHSLINEPVCGGGQRHAGIRRDKGSKPICYRRIEPDGRGSTLTHDYIVVDKSRIGQASKVILLDSLALSGLRHPACSTPAARETASIFTGQVFGQGPAKDGARTRKHGQADPRCGAVRGTGQWFHGQGPRSSGHAKYRY